MIMMMASVMMVIIVAVIMVVVVIVSLTMIMRVVVFVAMPMGSMTNQPPNEEDYTCESKHSTYNVALLRFNLLLKLEANHCNDASQNERGNHVSKRSQESDTPHT